MGSLGAMKQGSKDRYFQSEIEEANKFVPEGIEGRIPYRGPLNNSLYQLLGGIKSAMGYLGAPTLQDLNKNAEFVRISSAALRESHVHDVYITREAPNYKEIKMSNNHKVDRPVDEGILVLDYGSQYTLLIARRLREIGIYAEIIDGARQEAPADFNFHGIILSGGPDSVHEDGSRHLPNWVLESENPYLAYATACNL